MNENMENFQKKLAEMQRKLNIINNDIEEIKNNRKALMNNKKIRKHTNTTFLKTNNEKSNIFKFSNISKINSNFFNKKGKNTFKDIIKSNYKSYFPDNIKEIEKSNIYTNNLRNKNILTMNHMNDSKKSYKIFKSSFSATNINNNDENYPNNFSKNEFFYKNALNFDYKTLNLDEYNIINNKVLDKENNYKKDKTQDLNDINQYQYPSRKEKKIIKKMILEESCQKSSNSTQNILYNNYNYYGNFFNNQTIDTNFDYSSKCKNLNNLMSSKYDTKYNNKENDINHILEDRRKNKRSKNIEIMKNKGPKYNYCSIQNYKNMSEAISNIKSNNNNHHHKKVSCYSVDIENDKQKYLKNKIFNDSNAPSYDDKIKNDFISKIINLYNDSTNSNLSSKEPNALIQTFNWIKNNNNNHKQCDESNNNKNNSEYKKLCEDIMKEYKLENIQQLKMFIKKLCRKVNNNKNFIEGIKKILMP